MLRTVLLHGSVLAALLFSLQMLMHFQQALRLSLDVFAGLLSLLFLALGVSLARAWNGPPQNHTVSRSADVATKTPPGADAARAAPLTQRELQVLALVADGLSNHEIADELDISLNTAKSHLANLYGKLGVSRRTQAIRRAGDLELLS